MVLTLLVGGTDNNVVVFTADLERDGDNYTITNSSMSMDEIFALPTDTVLIAKLYSNENITQTFILSYNTYTWGTNILYTSPGSEGINIRSIDFRVLDNVGFFFFDTLVYSQE